MKMEGMTISTDSSLTIPAKLGISCYLKVLRNRPGYSSCGVPPLTIPGLFGIYAKSKNSESQNHIGSRWLVSYRFPTWWSTRKEETTSRAVPKNNYLLNSFARSQDSEVLFCYGLIHTKKESDNTNRGATIKALAIGCVHQYFHIYKVHFFRFSEHLPCFSSLFFSFFLISASIHSIFHLFLRIVTKNQPNWISTIEFAFIVFEPSHIVASFMGCTSQIFRRKSARTWTPATDLWRNQCN